MSLLRSLLFSTPLLLLVHSFLGDVSIIVSFFDRTGNVEHRLARIWSRTLLWVSFIRVRAETT